jgi:hypothetical protein
MTHTVYSSYCRRCGCGEAPHFGHLCTRCNTALSTIIDTIVRPALIERGMNISPSCPRNALYKYANEIAIDRGFTPDPYFDLPNAY